MEISEILQKIGAQGVLQWKAIIGYNISVAGLDTDQTEWCVRMETNDRAAMESEDSDSFRFKCLTDADMLLRETRPVPQREITADR